jgi:RES domain-containing protein
MGQRVLYFSSSLSLCVLELRANAVSFRRIREAYYYYRLDVELSQNGEMAPESLYSRDWIPNKRSTQGYGGDWYGRKNSLILTVKSAVLPTECNYIVNTTHTGFDSLVFSASLSIPLDSRLN